MDIRRLDNAASVSPQILPEDCARLREAGFVMVINNRPDGEEPGQPTAAQIAAAAEQAGLAYRAIPVAGGFSQGQAEEMAVALREAGGPVLAFCRSGTRSTLLWALAQASAGADPSDIEMAAAGAGYDLAPIRPHLARLSTTG